MLYKFLNYIQWPEQAFPSLSSPYIMAVLGSPEVFDELSAIAQSRTAGERPIEVERVDAPDDIYGSHMVFIGEDYAADLPVLVRHARRTGALVVTEDSDGIRPGSVINLRVVDGRVAFEVSLTAAETIGAKLSSRLLSVAASVKQGEQ